MRKQSLVKIAASALAAATCVHAAADADPLRALALRADTQSKLPKTTAVAVEPQNRERCYARTRAILTHNLPIALDWIARFGGRLTWREPQAGAIALVRYDADIKSLEIADRVRVNQSTLIVPVSHVGLEGYLRIWLGGREECLREGLRRIASELTPLFD